jgi:hypothetical protein
VVEVVNEDGIIIDLEYNLGKVWLHAQAPAWKTSVAKRFKVLFDGVCGDLWEDGVSYLYANIHINDQQLKKFAKWLGFHELHTAEMFSIWVKDL